MPRLDLGPNETAVDSGILGAPLRIRFQLSGSLGPDLGRLPGGHHVDPRVPWSSGGTTLSHSRKSSVSRNGADRAGRAVCQRPLRPRSHRTSPAITARTTAMTSNAAPCTGCATITGHLSADAAYGTPTAAASHVTSKAQPTFAPCPVGFFWSVITTSPSRRLARVRSCQPRSGNWTP
jgi:hypothetical protein